MSIRHSKKPRYPITDVAEATAERVKLGGEVLISLTHAFAASEKRQQKFQLFVIQRLSRLEAMLYQVHRSQLVWDQKLTPYFGEWLQADLKNSEEYIAKECARMGLAAVKYIYGTDEEAATTARGKGKWSGWEI
jgi:hypothetical protein